MSSGICQLNSYTPRLRWSDYHTCSTSKVLALPKTGRRIRRAASNVTKIKSISCTPHAHLKDDDEQQSWRVTEKKLFSVDFWFNLEDGGTTLEDMAAAVEDTTNASLKKTNTVTVAGGVYSGRVVNIVIRGRDYQREILQYYGAADYLFDGEVFKIEFLH